jgi:hypothetical protein
MDLLLSEDRDRGNRLVGRVLSTTQSIHPPPTPPPQTQPLSPSLHNSIPNPLRKTHSLQTAENSKALTDRGNLLTHALWGCNANN